jgi:hypothetical protein
MKILRERVVWTKATPRARSARIPDLTIEEIANVRHAFRFLSAQIGRGQPIARAMGLTTKIVEHSLERRRRPSVGFALRLSRLAKVNVEEILAGRWPTPVAD